MTTVTTSKKKLVYKQDPDGVFRLKKLEPEPATPDKKSVDDYLNDLVSCAYEVAAPHKPRPSPSDDEGLVMSGVSSVKSLPADRDCDQSLNPTLRSHEPSAFKMSVSSSLGLFHVPSFACGAGLALVGVRMAPQLWVYLQVFFNYAKVGVLWAAVLGAGAWYAGLIKPADVSGLKRRATTLLRSNPASGNEELVDSDSDEPSPPQQHQRRSLAPRLPSPTRPPPLTSRKNTVTNVVPFRPLTRDQVTRFQSNPELPERKPPPKLARVHTADASIRRRYDDRPRRTSAASIESPRHRASPVDCSFHANAHEELPFINEVRLVSQDDVEPVAAGHHHQPSMAYAKENDGQGVRRLNTTASKKSILGTRANYSKFLETAQDLDYE